MAIRIIGEDDKVRRVATCTNCAAVLEYTKADTRVENVRDYGGGSDDYRRLQCPRCHTILTVPLH